MNNPIKINQISSLSFFYLLHKIPNQVLLHLGSLHADIIFIFKRETIHMHVYHSCLDDPVGLIQLYRWILHEWSLCFFSLCHNLLYKENNTWTAAPSQIPLFFSDKEFDLIPKHYCFLISVLFIIHFYHHLNRSMNRHPHLTQSLQLD